MAHGIQEHEGQLERWIEELSMYNMHIVHRTGRKHVNDDGMSRIPTAIQLAQMLRIFHVVVASIM